MSNDLTFEVTEFFQDRQQRFEAALAVTIASLKKGYDKHASIEAGVGIADLLITKLNETEVEEKP